MTKEKEVKEPLFHITKRKSMNWWQSLLTKGASIFAAVIVVGILSIVFIGQNPFRIFGTFLKGLFIDPWTLILDTALLLGFGLAILPAFKMKYWNMGANGQILMSCLAAIYCMIEFTGKMPEPLIILLMFVASVLMGILWAVIPAIFKAFFNTNETLFTLMMNYTAIGLVNHFSYKYTNYQKVNIGIVNQLTKEAWLPQLGNKYVLPILIIAALTVLMYVYLKYSKHGYEISVVGESQNTARYVGINVRKVVIRTLGVCGVICGIIGFLYAGAISHTVSESTATLGFTAILIAWLAKFNPFVMVATALFVVCLKTGTGQINMDYSLGSTYFADIVTGILFFFVIGSEFFTNYKIKAGSRIGGIIDRIKKLFRKKEKAPAAENMASAGDKSEKTEDADVSEHTNKEEIKK